MQDCMETTTVCNVQQCTLSTLHTNMRQKKQEIWADAHNTTDSDTNYSLCWL